MKPPIRGFFVTLLSGASRGGERGFLGLLDATRDSGVLWTACVPGPGELERALAARGVPVQFHLGGARDCAFGYTYSSQTILSLRMNYKTLPLVWRVVTADREPHDGRAAEAATVVVPNARHLVSRFPHHARRLVILPNAPRARFYDYGPRLPAPGLPRILFVGPFTKEKGAPDLLLATRGLPVAIDLVGCHAPAPSPPNVTSHGFVEDVLPLLSRADLLALPSLTEGLPNAVLEAAAMGVPCVLSDIPGNREAVSGHALFHAPGDVAALRVELVKALAAPHLVRELAEKARDAIGGRTFEGEARRLVEVFLRAATANGAANGTE